MMLTFAWIFCEPCTAIFIVKEAESKAKHQQVSRSPISTQLISTAAHIYCSPYLLRTTLTGIVPPNPFS